MRVAHGLGDLGQGAHARRQRVLAAARGIQNDGRQIRRAAITVREQAQRAGGGFRVEIDALDFVADLLHLFRRHAELFKRGFAAAVRRLRQKPVVTVLRVIALIAPHAHIRLADLFDRGFFREPAPAIRERFDQLFKRLHDLQPAIRLLDAPIIRRPADAAFEKVESFCKPTSALRTSPAQAGYGDELSFSGKEWPTPRSLRDPRRQTVCHSGWLNHQKRSGPGSNYVPIPRLASALL
jgi:hypothetical protein